MKIESIEQLRVLGSSLEILYVEDDSDIQEQVYKMLSRIFVNIDTAVDGQEAFEKYNAKQYDLILTDIEMPRMDGIELSRKIIENNPEQNIFIISAHKNQSQLLKLMDIGVSGLILKPIDMHYFINKLSIKVKEIYANKMMKIHYEKIQKQLDNNSKIYEEMQKKDSLTSVYNYKYLLQHIKNDKNKTAILLNINNFKLINEYYSNNHGNHLLFQLAYLLTVEARTSKYTVFRVSGDEFLLLYDNENTSCKVANKDAYALVEKIRTHKFNITGVKDINIDVRVSYACSKTRLLEELTIALEYGKKCSLPVMGYNEKAKFDMDIENIVEIKSVLKNAIDNALVTPVYQPILMLNNEVKYEVLMRIEHDGNLLTPDKFLEIAKEHNYYNEISEMLIFKALESMSQSDKTFSINISYLDIKNSEFVERLEKKILEYNIADRVVFEIIESDIFDDMEIVLEFIERFKKHHIRFAIDDFGSGYSNFAYIIKLNPDYIKIDGSLIENILNDKKIYILVKSIIDLAHDIDIEVIAEFISSKELYNALSELGVDAMQGYYLGKPDRELKNVVKGA